MRVEAFAPLQERWSAPAVAVAAGALVVLILAQIGDAYGSWFAPD